jgi:rhamnulokinase
LHPDLYNPESMLRTCARLAGREPTNNAQWAGLALASLTATIASECRSLERLTQRRLRQLRVGGGGSQNASFCQSLADETGLEVCAGPAEATVLGNLAMQFVAQGVLTFGEAVQAVSASADTTTFYPGRD